VLFRIESSVRLKLFLDHIKRPSLIRVKDFAEPATLRDSEFAELQGIEVAALTWREGESAEKGIEVSTESGSAQSLDNLEEAVVNNLVNLKFGW
jgi:hypothetical protein